MNPLRFITAASLFDGHDVSINIMRRLLQSKGAEVIHLGHNRPAKEVAQAALSEDAHAVAISSYQGGHNEYFRYVRELLDKEGGHEIKIFGGGGGVITAKEIIELERNGIEKIYSPEDGMKMGLEGIIIDMINRSQHSTLDKVDFGKLSEKKFLSFNEIGKVISFIENTGTIPVQLKEKAIPILGVTGTGGAGKSSLIDEILLRFHLYHSSMKIALISIDPTKRRDKRALLGDRIRLGSASFDNFYIRSLATRTSKNELSPHTNKVVSFLKSQDFDLIMIETSGIGQANDEITQIADKCVYVMTPEYGAQTQLEKIEMLDSANFIVINKFEKQRSEDALRDVRKQYRRSHKLFNLKGENQNDDDLPIFGTMASKFNDTGVNDLYYEIIKSLEFSTLPLEKILRRKVPIFKDPIIPLDKSMYLRNIVSICRKYNQEALEHSKKLDLLESLEKVEKHFGESKDLKNHVSEIKNNLPSLVLKEISDFENTISQYKQGVFKYQVRGKEIQVGTQFTSLCGQKISKVGIPHFSSLKDKYLFIKLQNLPGHFPYASGIFPFRRTDEDPKRMFAGEGGPSRTNERFHYLSKNDSAKRLSTAFDSVTLYGEDPDHRPDIFGKIGESGVSICTLDDMEDLFKGFKLTDKNTSVSMTINGPAPIILAMFMNTAIKQNLSSNDQLDSAKRLEVMKQVRGTVQADILKEDQAQNTCIFSFEFALKLMGDVQEYFSRNAIKNYYTVSISGYHIAEAGANPITQLAFTLANGLTYLEYYLGRGLNVDDVCPNLSFFFSNGLDPEYTVMGRVARKIWSVAMKFFYEANQESQRLKYHIQTSGRSLHAQEIDFNDIRTTLQAFLALSDNCNSLHTNAYDEAITTPTEESVRRAMAIQMIINREFGLSKTDNPLQGSFIYDELSEMVEEAVYKEFEKISDKGGVLGAMESMYQRSKIQEESLYYESLKDSGELPIIGVNTYVAENIEEKMKQEIKMIRASMEEKENQITRLNSFKVRHQNQSGEYLEKLKKVVLENKNIFEELLTTVNHCSLGQITKVLYEVGGKYRRNV